MIQLIWGILNIAIILYFIVICFRATKLIRDNIGTFGAVVFSFVLLSFITNPKKDKDTVNQSLRFEPTEQKNKELDKPSLNTYLSTIIIDEDLISKINITIKYDTEKVISATTYKTGYTIGTTWKPSYIEIKKIGKKDQCEYIVSGVNEWQLVGFVLYSQPKDYKGIAELKKEQY